MLFWPLLLAYLILAGCGAPPVPEQARETALAFMQERLDDTADLYQKKLSDKQRTRIMQRLSKNRQKLGFLSSYQLSHAESHRTSGGNYYLIHMHSHYERYDQILARMQATEASETLTLLQTEDKHPIRIVDWEIHAGKSHPFNLPAQTPKTLPPS